LGYGLGKLRIAELFATVVYAPTARPEEFRGGFLKSKKMESIANKHKLAHVESTNPFKVKNIGRFLLINFIVATGVQLALCTACFTDWELMIRSLDDYAYSFIISCFLSGGISMIVDKADEHFTWLDAPLSRLVFDITVVTAYSFVVSFCLVTIFSIFVWDNFTFQNVSWSDIATATKTPIFIALGLTLFFTSRSFLIEWRQAAIEAEQMKSERLQWQYQSLKDQLNPHFLFNSLNVLSNLVYESADQANAFIEKLSGIYRYVLDVQYEELVGLDQEVAFAKNYLELQELRFGSKLKYDIAVDSKPNLKLPPLTLQLLLENAIKHNAATKAEPLTIAIEQKGDKLVVRNNVNLRSTAPGESGIGLKNIHERYGFLTDEKVIVTETEEYFEVILPVLNQKYSA
jgi:sensor histidine kinase YesM